jgi:ATP-dependent Clp protease adapter protein ClpS
MSDRMWCVVVFNDDATPMEFVVYLLQRVFQRGADEAEQTMLDTHEHGMAICGVYDRREDAVAKIAEASSLVREHGHPLRLQYACGDPALWSAASATKTGIFRKWLRGIDKQVWNAFWQGA